jgi:hypothetical protein
VTRVLAEAGELKMTPTEPKIVATRVMQGMKTLMDFSISTPLSDEIGA